MNNILPDIQLKYFFTLRKSISFFYIMDFTSLLNQLNALESKSKMDIQKYQAECESHKKTKQHLQQGINNP